MRKVVAIVGRPNVGKSTLFNRLSGNKKAIVHETSGVTRDRNYSEVDWQGRKFFLIDTGGFVPHDEETFNRHIREQVKLAIEESDIILFIVDGSAGYHPIDAEIISLLRKYSGDKEVILVVNKIDNEQREPNAADFYKLGLENLFVISALSGRNTADLLDKITKGISAEESEEVEDTRKKFAVIGRPNAGKSSIVNAILKEDRNIVTAIPGTTRDSIDSVIKYHGEDIVIIDTAGLVKKSKLRRAESIDFFSAVRTYKAIQRCDVAVLVIDVSIIMDEFEKVSDITLSPFKVDRQDIKIIEEVLEFKKGLLIVINKWDLVEKDSKTSKIIEQKFNEHLRSYDFIKMIFISALTKQRIHKVLEEAVEVYIERGKSVKTSELNEALIRDIRITPPPPVKGKEIKINYITQVKTSPPVFAFFCNDPKSISENYRKFLERKLRGYFGYKGVPVTLIFKKKN